MSTKKRFENKVAVVTASSTGIGFAIVRRLAKEGAKVVISSRNEKNVNEAVKIIRDEGGIADGIICNAGSLEDIKKLVKFTIDKFGGIDVLIPNAAISPYMGKFLNTPEKAIDSMYKVNFKGAFFLIKEAIPFMQNRQGANIILMSSFVAYAPQVLPIGFYAITKTMLLSMTHILSTELSSDQIRVNCIAPGLIKTEFSKPLWQGKETELQELLGIMRLGTVDEIANCVAFFASDDAGYINGETLCAAGRPSARF